VGDAPIHGDHDAAAQALAERAAALRLFGLLPPDQAAAFRALWDEFEAGETDDAVFARSVDRVQPLVSNLQSGGVTWTRYAVTVDQIETRVGAKVRRGAPRLWDHLAPRVAAWFAARA
jgi:putative hydrolases of HD superfamily